MSVALATTYVVTASQMRWNGIRPGTAPAVFILAVTGGVLGSKVYFATDMVFREGGRWSHYFLSESGMTWFGGLAGGLLGALLAASIFRFPLRSLMNSAAISLPLGQAIGRLGCFLNGDDYGSATASTWGMSFPHGSPPVAYPVHPAQLYEIAWLLPVAAFLFYRRAKSPFLFGEYLILAGLGRAAIEIVRVNPKVALGMTEAQLIGLTIACAGALEIGRTLARSR